MRFSHERFVLSGPGGTEARCTGEWANLKEMQVTDRLCGRIVMDRPRAGLFTIAPGSMAGSILCRSAVQERGPGTTYGPCAAVR